MHKIQHVTSSTVNDDFRKNAVLRNLERELGDIRVNAIMIGLAAVVTVAALAFATYGFHEKPLWSFVALVMAVMPVFNIAMLVEERRGLIERLHEARAAVVRLKPTR